MWVFGDAQKIRTFQIAAVLVMYSISDIDIDFSN